MRAMGAAALERGPSGAGKPFPTRQRVQEDYGGRSKAGPRGGRNSTAPCCEGRPTLIHRPGLLRGSRTPQAP